MVVQEGTLWTRPFLRHNLSLNRCFGSGSALILVGWIRIQEGKNAPQKQEKVKKFHVLTAIFDTKKILIFSAVNF
jgi:hypothetical protein